MWRSRYWAVLGFQTLLALLIVIFGRCSCWSKAESVLESAARGRRIIAAAGTLFWFLVKALARIQMPDRRPRRALILATRSRESTAAG